MDPEKGSVRLDNLFPSYIFYNECLTNPLSINISGFYCLVGRTARIKILEIIFDSLCYLAQLEKYGSQKGQSAAFSLLSCSEQFRGRFCEYGRPLPTYLSTY